MNPDRLARLKEILLQVMEAPEDERSACLERLTEGDEELSREAASLLAMEGIAVPLLRTSGAIPERPSADAMPTTLGPYRILGVLGQGGMGTVYHAEQSEPIRRQVALKVIRTGLESKAAIQRFELERRAPRTSSSKRWRDNRFRRSSTSASPRRPISR